jgi:hypothetical protein
MQNELLKRTTKNYPPPDGLRRKWRTADKEGGIGGECNKREKEEHGW